MPGRDEALAVTLALTVALAMVVLALVTVLAGRGGPSTAAGFESEPTCAEWTDGCIVCRRTAEGPACSTAGFACAPTKPQCLRRQGI